MRSMFQSMVGWAVFAVAQGAAGGTVYQNDFEKAALGKLPDDLLVLEGAWSVKGDAGNRFIEIPGAPLETLGVLFGPADAAGGVVSARAFGTSQGRRAPAFGVGLGGAGGFKLLVAPGRKELELWRGEERLAGVAYAWEAGTWTWLRLQLRQAGAGWQIEGKAWKEGGPEPGAWLVMAVEKSAPPSGRAAVWAYPFSGTPIRFDDLKVEKLAD